MMLKKKLKLFDYRYIIISLATLAANPSFTATVSIETSQYPEVLEAAKKLPTTGTLKVSYGEKKSTSDRFFYLKVDQRYISEIAPLLKNTMSMPDDNFLGAHISVVLHFEAKRMPKNIPELGKEFSFTLDQFDKVVTNKTENDSQTTWYIITVKSQELSAFRKKYKLTSLPYGEHEFHISIAKQVLKEP